MAQPYRNVGSIEATGALVSATDQTGAAMDYDAVNGYAQITAKASGVGASLGLRFRAVVAGVLTTLLSFAPGSTAAAFAGNLSAQAVTATTLQTSGNVGFGVAPTTGGGAGFNYVHHGADFNVFANIAGSASGSANLSQNAFFNGTTWNYVESAAASNLLFTGGTVQLRTAAAGTAGGVITWTTALSIASTGAATLANGLTVSTGTLTAPQLNAPVLNMSGVGSDSIGGGPLAQWINGTSGIILQLSTGSHLDVWGDVSNSVTRIGRFTNTGVLAWGTTVTAGAVAGDVVMHNNNYLRFVNQAGLAVIGAIGFDTSDQLNLNANGKTLVIQNGSTGTAVGAAGGASAMPTPASYLSVTVGGTPFRVALFN